MSAETVNTRKLIQYYPIYYNPREWNPWQESPYPVIEEMIWTGEEWMTWTGDYKITSSNSIKPDRVIAQWELPTT